MTGGRFFEDFTHGEDIAHATPRTLTAGDAAVYQSLYGVRFAPQSSAEFARALGYRAAPLDDWLVFHVIFGKSVPDISFNAVANLGYAEGVFLAPVFAGDTLKARSQVIGLKANSDGKTGIVMVRTTGLNQEGAEVLRYIRWVVVARRAPADAPPDEAASLPDVAPVVAPDALQPPPVDYARADIAVSGDARLFEDYKVGDRLEHPSGITLEEAEHMLATRLYQNTARVHFDAYRQAETRFKRRLVYGGHIISHARALSFDGLANAYGVAALNAGTHAAPAFAGDTIYAASEILDRAEISGRSDIGALRVRHIVVKDADFDDACILDLDCWVWMPRR